MISASFYAKRNPQSKIAFDNDESGLLLLGGTNARTVIDLLELKGQDEYIGYFRVNGADYLNIANPNRDRYPISVVVATSLAFNVLRSQVPLGGVIDDSPARENALRYLTGSELPKEMHLNFLHLIEGVYSELCAKPNYLVLDLSGADTIFAKTAVDLLSKILKTYPIYCYAPQLFAVQPEGVSFISNIHTFLKPEPQAVEREEVKPDFRDTANTMFLTDLFGQGYREAVKEALKEEEVEAKTVSKTILWLVASCLTMLLAVVSAILYYGIWKNGELIPFAIHYTITFLCLVGSGISGAFLFQHRARKRFWDNGHLRLQIVITDTLAIIAFAVIFVVMILRGIRDDLFTSIVFLVTFALEPIILTLYFLFENKILIKKYPTETEKENKRLGK